jgi:replication factor C subunit 3/5
MNQTFIAKYKPYYIKDFTKEKSMLDILDTLFNIDDLNILFVGNYSSGKTTLLYALIREYYGFKKEDFISENNILFINNLKEQGINYYRNEMKTFCQSKCSIFGKKKLVIIDDIDNINEQCQQVFRNYIDKYKNNVNFISVCTNIQKVIESYQSRMHIININSHSNEDLRRMMQIIIDTEKLTISHDAQEYILTIANYSIRNMINNLEKIYILDCHIDINNCKKICTNISFQLFETYIEKLKNGDLYECIQILYGIYDYGYSVIDILDYFFTFIKTTTLLTEDNKYEIIPFLCKYITMVHNIHEDLIELAFFTNKIYAKLHKTT